MAVEEKTYTAIMMRAMKSTPTEPSSFGIGTAGTAAAARVTNMIATRGAVGDRSRIYTPRNMRDVAEALLDPSGKSLDVAPPDGERSDITTVNYEL